MIPVNPVSAGGTSMKSNTVSSSGASSQTSATSSGNTKSLGQDEFLTLLIAQLKNQDPMNPMDNAKFTAQMAQFSSLEQLMNINKSLDNLTTSSNATNSAQAMSLIGKEVKAQGTNIHLKNGVASDISLELPNAAKSVTITIEDQNGAVVKRIDAGSMSSGAHQVQWDGKDSSGAPLADGLYSYIVQAKDMSGATLDVSTFTRGIVDSVSFDNGVAYVHIGNLKYMLSEILEVSLPKVA